jgi:hypothetical protein
MAWSVIVVVMAKSRRSLLLFESGENIPPKRAELVALQCQQMKAVGSLKAERCKLVSCQESKLD